MVQAFIPVNTSNFAKRLEPELEGQTVMAYAGDSARTQTTRSPYLVKFSPQSTAHRVSFLFRLSLSRGILRAP